MITPSPHFVSTDLATLRVRRTGTGPPVVLWHSLFVDSRSWGSVADQLAQGRTVYSIDGPSHGGSSAVTRDFSFDECVACATQALDGLGLREPVDWVGNAWGGHIGLRLAAAAPSRLRTLTTIGTPIAGFTLKEKLTLGWPPVLLYRLTGPSSFLVKKVSDALLGSEAVAAQRDHAAVVLDAFRSADRDGMYHAMRSMMLLRPGMENLLADIAVPTLMMPVRDDVAGWRPDEARRTAAAIPDCRIEEVAGTGHIAPLLIDHDRVVRLLTDFWSSVPARADATGPDTPRE
jgi:pimeloyl-ACP methyl ester carboxylesterase